jgi:hypothetical protein
MPKPRERKTDHLLYADAVDSRGKSGVWFGERDEFQSAQREVMDVLRDRLDWVALDDAIMAVSLDPPGIAVITPNPSLPGILILADGATQANTDALKQRYTDLVREVLAEKNVNVA